ncbi:hypothetical protein UlMin_032524, partial [Ulmus minor]
ISALLFRIPATQSLLPASSPFLLFGSAEETSCKSFLGAQIPFKQGTKLAMEVVYGTATKLVELLSSTAYKEISLAWGVDEELKKLRRTMSIIHDVLLDAEDKQQNQQIKSWLVELNDVLVDAELLLDEFKCEYLRNKVVKKHGTIGRKVQRFFSRSNPLVFRIRCGHKIKDIQKKVQELADLRAGFGLKVGHRELITRETDSYLRSLDLVIGRDVDKERVIELLFKPSDNLSVIPIQGMGGLGKTTLAKFVYNDEGVKTKFDLKMWVCVSEDFEVRKLVGKILDSATSGFKDKGDMSLDVLQNHLRDELKNRRFLLVLDDVWSDDRTKWNALKGLLMEGSKGSKIIVTTRKESVAELMGDVETYHLEGLCWEDCWSLFVKCAFKDGEEKRNQKLIDMGKQIVEKCKGVPLAVTSLGRLLYSELEPQKWRSVRDSELWELKGKEVDIFPALQLSYNELPSYLKQCFHYCALFPKDHLFSNVQLIQFWMAHGLLQSHSGKGTLEDVGEMYLKELLSRGFFQDVERAGFDESIYFFYMHDLIHDLAQLMSQNECSTIRSPTINVSERVQHLLVTYSFGEELACLDKMKRVQTMIVRTEEQVSVPVSASFIGKYFSKFKFLRVLDLQDFGFEVLPSDIGRMKHLRYLDLSGNDAITELAVSICELQSLETLILGGCGNLKVLPEDFNSLISLRLLTITTTAMNLPRMECLTSLRSLWIVQSPNLISLPINPTLEILVIDDCEMFTLTENKDNDQVGKLSLRKLILGDLPEMTAFPRWLQGCEDTLNDLSIARCHNFTALPDWLPNMASLEKLLIDDCSELQSLPAERMHLLTSLQRLEIVECPELRNSVKVMRKDWLHNIDFEHDYDFEDDE